MGWNDYKLAKGSKINMLKYFLISSVNHFNLKQFDVYHVDFAPQRSLIIILWMLFKWFSGII